MRDSAFPTVVHTLSDSVERIDWHPAGRLLAALDLAGQVALVDLEDPTASTSPTGMRQPGGGAAIAWSPDGEQLAVGGAQGTVSLLHPNGCDTRFLDGPVAALAWSPGGDLLAIAAGWSVTVLTATGELVAEVGPLAGAVHDLAWAHGPGALAAGTRNAVVWLAPGLAPTPVESWDVTGATRTLAADPSRRRLASGDLAGVLRIADLSQRTELAVSGFEHRIERIAWNAAGTAVAVPDENDITIWDVDGIALVKDDPVHLCAHDRRITDLAYAPGSMGPDRLASVGEDGRLAFWYVPAPNGPLVIEMPSPGRCLRWRPGHASVAVGGADGTVRVVRSGGGVD